MEIFEFFLGRNRKKLTTLILMFFISLVLLFSVSSGAEARSNKEDIQKEIADGWEVTWGEKEIDHLEYAILAAKITQAYLTSDPRVLYDYFKDLLYEMIQELGTDVVLKALKHRGSLFTEGELEVQGGIATYDHWHEEWWGTMNEPNTHQPYVRWRRVAEFPPPDEQPPPDESLAEIAARKQAVLLLLNQYMLKGF